MLSPAEVRLGADEVARELRVHRRTAQRRLAAWHQRGTPRVERVPSARGEPHYTITREQLALAVPEIDDA